MIGLALLVLTVSLLFVVYYKKNRLEINEIEITSISNEYEITLGVYADMADLVYQVCVDSPEIKGLFARGVKSRNPEEKDRCRKLLYRELAEVYQKLLHYNFRQLHFHEKNNRSYLRFHRPDKYGDDLTESRYSVDYVNREKEYIRGFEEGTIFNGYRFVYPLAAGDEHLGSVEISVSMDAVLRQFRDRFNREAQFVILEKQVRQKVFASEMGNYVSWWIDADYLLDRGILEKGILENRITVMDAVKIKNAITTNRENGLPFCVEIKINSAPRILTFLPIKNFVGENVAYIFVISDSKKFIDQDRYFYFIFAALITLFVLIVVFTMYYKCSQKKIVGMATFDSLTKVYARGALMKMVAAEYERYKRYKKSFSLIMVDVDHFKKINDKYGHNAGDLVLSGIASVMKTHVRKSDVIGRYGGEEFLVLLPETQRKDAAAVAEKLRQMIAAHNFDGIDKVTVSCGVAEIFEQAQTVEAFIDKADKKLYTAKGEGRNRVVA